MNVRGKELEYRQNYSHMEQLGIDLDYRQKYSHIKQ